MAAASARLCVETLRNIHTLHHVTAAASARLCVETTVAHQFLFGVNAAASARLCVETQEPPPRMNENPSSRLRAAVC